MYVEAQRKERSGKNRTIALKEQIVEIGTKLKVKWSQDELGDSGWRPGWYTTTVQGYDEDTNLLTVTYPSEPGLS